MQHPQKIKSNFNKQVKTTANEVRVREKQERVTQFTNQYFERNFNRFHSKAMNTLLKQEAPAPAFHPHGMQHDRKADMRSLIHI